MKKLISIICPCFNEEENILNLYRELSLALSVLDNYKFEIIFIDNASEDKTVEKIKEIAKSDLRIKAIINSRNFGHNRSPYWALLNCNGDAAIIIAADLQDPPAEIGNLLREWEKGWKVVMGRKPKSVTNLFFHQLRKLYYRFLNAISNINLINDANGFGVYDRSIIEIIRSINDPDPYLRGLVCEIGFPIKTIEYTQNKRNQGKSKNSIYVLYDQAMLAITSHSIVPIRIISIVGFMTAILSFAWGAIFLFYKILNWDSVSFGIAPLLITISFILGVILVFLGFIGEYVASIHKYVKKRPIVVESERLNF